MKILGVDTTTKFLCLGIYSDKKIYEYNLDLGRSLSALITVTINRALEALGWKAGDIDYFACGLGPGSFTGIRVGISTIKGLAFSLNKPVIGVNTLDILATNAAGREEFIIPAIDAKRNLIYSSVYRNNRGVIRRVKPYMLLGIDEFLKKAKVKGNAVLLGDAAGLYKEEILMKMKNAAILDRDYWYPCGRNIIDLAIKKISGKKADSAQDIKPVYLYPKECQVRKGALRI